MAGRSSVNIQLQGFPLANRDAIVTLTQEATGATFEAKPFLDGGLMMRDLDPGYYEVVVKHPNVIPDLERRRIRIFDQPTPTFVPIQIPENLFRDTPIRETPEADFGPMQRQFTSVRTQLERVNTKSPGSVILAEDWNMLVTAVQDLSAAMLQLTRLVSPVGHDHPEIEEKIDEVQDNLRRFQTAFGNSLLELQRQIQLARLERNARDAMAAGGASADDISRIREAFESQREKVAYDSQSYTRGLLGLAGEVNHSIQNILVNVDPDDPIVSNPLVQATLAESQALLTMGTSNTAERELQSYKAVPGGHNLPGIGIFGS